jgi:2-alkenal reductase
MRHINRFFALLGMVAFVVVVGLFAAGNLTWSPAYQLGAAENGRMTGSALTAQPSVLIVNDEDGLLPTQERLTELYRFISPSVVNIQVTRPASAGSTILPIPQQGQGTGWVWDTEGHIVTNHHVVDGATAITVFFNNGLWAEGEVVATDDQADLAVVSVIVPDGVEPRPLSLAPTLPEAGNYAVAFGSPFGLAGSMTQGIVSAVGRSLSLGTPTESGSRYSLPEVIQTDAAINPGNSGGPLVNLNGEVIGVNFAIRSEERSNSGVGFAIPVTIVERVIPALISEGRYAYPYLGIGGLTVGPEVVRQENLPRNLLGVYVSQVPAQGPSARAGVRTGDVVTAIDQQEVRNFEDLIGYLIQETTPGDQVTLSVFRGGETLTVEVTLSERPGAGSTTTIAQQITVGEAVTIAKDVAQDEAVLERIDSAMARQSVRGGVGVWIVTLGGATPEGVETEIRVVIDRQSGEVLEILDE